MNEIILVTLPDPEKMEALLRKACPHELLLEFLVPRLARRAGREVRPIGIVIALLQTVSECCAEEGWNFRTSTIFVLVARDWMWKIAKALADNHTAIAEIDAIKQVWGTRTMQPYLHDT